MIYVLTRNDGNPVTILSVMPQTIRANDGSAVYRANAFRDGRIFATCIEGENAGQSVAIAVGVDAQDLRPGSIPDLTVEFFPVEDEIAKLPYRDSVIGVDEIGRRDLPEDRTFRDVWLHAAGKCDVDMPKARGIWRDKMRRAREPKLAALDVAYQRADETRDSAAKTAAADAKQALRDVTAHPGIDAAKTPAALKEVWPAVLGAATVLATRA